MRERQPHPLIPALLLALAANCLTASHAHAQSDVIDRELARQVREAILIRPDGSHTQLISALRNLRDPRLRPLFGKLAASERGELRRLGILGMAELADNQRINILMVANITDSALRSDILLDALNEGLIHPSQVGEVLTWSDLHPLVEARYRLRHYVLTGEVDIERINELSRSEDSPAELVALLVRCESGDAQACRLGAEALCAEPLKTNRVRAAAILELIRENRLTNTGPLIAEISECYAEDDLVGMAAIRSLLIVDPRAGRAHWLNRFDHAHSSGEKYRLALAALESAESAPVAVFERLLAEPEGSLLECIGRAGRAVSQGVICTETLSELAARRHAPSIDWVIRRTRALSTEDAAAVLESALAAWCTPSSERDAHPDASVSALAREILLRNPASLLLPLNWAATQGDVRLCLALLNGMIDGTECPPVWNPESPPRWPSQACEALATLYEARAGEPLAHGEPHLDRLRSIGLGWGGLPEPLRTQAAWIALCGDGAERSVLARVLGSPD